MPDDIDMIATSKQKHCSGSVESQPHDAHPCSRSRKSGDPGQDLDLCSSQQGQKVLKTEREIASKGAGQALLGCTEKTIDGARGDLVAVLEASACGCTVTLCNAHRRNGSFGFYALMQ